MSGTHERTRQELRDGAGTVELKMHYPEGEDGPGVPYLMETSAGDEWPDRLLVTGHLLRANRSADKGEDEMGMTWRPPGEDAPPGARGTVRVELMNAWAEYRTVAYIAEDDTWALELVRGAVSGELPPEL